MALRERVRDWLFPDGGGFLQEQKQVSGVSGPQIYYNESTTQAQTRSVRQVSQYGYMDNITVYRAINILADACAAISWDVYKGYGKNKVKQDETHPLALLMNQPNKNQAMSSYVRKLICHWMIAGTVYQFAAFPGDVFPRSDVTPQGLYILHPLLTEPQTQNGELVSYKYQIGPRFVEYPLWKILPLKFFHPIDELAGVSPVMVAALVVERQNEGEAWNFALMKHAARPSGVFVAQNRLGEVAYSELKAEIRKTWGTGKRNAGYPLVLDNGLQYVQLALSPMDIDWNNSDSNAGRKIATAIGVDPLLLNDKQHSTYNNVREARLAMAEMTVIPIMSMLRDEWNGWLAPFYGQDISVDYDKSEIEILRGNRAIFSGMVLSEWNGGLRSFNEATDELKLGKTSDNDDFYKFGPTTFIRKSQIGAWLDQQEGNRESAAQGLQLAQQANAQNRNKPPDTLPPGSQDTLQKMAVKGDLLLRRVNVQEIKKAGKTASPAQKAYYNAINQERDVWAEKVAGDVATYFDEEFAACVAMLQNAHTLADAKQAVVLTLSQHAQALPHVLVPYYIAIAESFKNRVASSMGLSYKSLTIQTKDALADLALYGAQHIVNIQETTQQKIYDLFLQADMKSYSVQELQDSLQETYSGFKSSRAYTIARTETLAASNLGSQLAMQATGLPIVKSWLAINDTFTRDWHDEADGQERDLREPYEVNGEQLLFPGDTSLGATAGNIVNCRCCEIYSLDESRLPLEKARLFLQQKFNPYHDHLGRFASGGRLALNPVGQNELPGMGGFNLVDPHVFRQPHLLPMGAGNGQYTNPFASHSDAKLSDDDIGVSPDELINALATDNYHQFGNTYNATYKVTVGKEHYFLKEYQEGDNQRINEKFARDASKIMGIDDMTTKAIFFDNGNGQEFKAEPWHSDYVTYGDNSRRFYRGVEKLDDGKLTTMHTYEYLSADRDHRNSGNYATDKNGKPMLLDFSLGWESFLVDASTVGNTQTFLWDAIQSKGGAIDRTALKKAIDARNQYVSVAKSDGLSPDAVSGIERRYKVLQEFYATGSTSWDDFAEYADTQNGGDTSW